jgi:hypothetical protein
MLLAVFVSAFFVFSSFCSRVSLVLFSCCLCCFCRDVVVVFVVCLIVCFRFVCCVPLFTAVFVVSMPFVVERLYLYFCVVAFVVF